MVSTPAYAESSAVPVHHAPESPYHILAGKLFDSVSRTLLPQQAITIDRNSGTILNVQPIADFQSMPANHEAASHSDDIIDLLHLTILPGFVDTHVHRMYTAWLLSLRELPVFKCSCTHTQKHRGMTRRQRKV